MENKIGVVVVLEFIIGEVLAMISLLNYNLNFFVIGYGKGNFYGWFLVDKM